jgi:hypothetical protein
MATCSKQSEATGLYTLTMSESEVTHVWEALVADYRDKMRANRDHNAKLAVDEKQTKGVRQCFAESAAKWREKIAEVDALIQVLD